MTQALLKGTLNTSLWMRALRCVGNYRVLLPDLYKGKVGVDAEEASHLSDGLDFKQASEEVRVAAEWLRQSGAPKVPRVQTPAYIRGPLHNIYDVFATTFSKACMHCQQCLSWHVCLQPRACNVSGCAMMRCVAASPQVGSIGFCMGGSLSLIAAEHAKIDAAVSFYGTPSNKKDLSHARSPLRVLPCAHTVRLAMAPVLPA